MSSDDSLSWILKQITEVAKTIGQAKKELDGAMKGIIDPRSYVATTSPQQPLRPIAPRGAVVNPQQIIATPVTKPSPPPDPLVIAAKNEGIDTNGKTRDQIATELAIKLNSSRK